MRKATAKSALKVQAFLGDTYEVLEFEESTATSEQAAAAIGCTVAQIAKSLIFKGKKSGDPVLIVASGINRVDEKKVRDLLGEKISRPDAEFVREVTGFAIGGIPPVGHTTEMKVLLDEDLQTLETIWAAAGTPNAVFNLTVSALPELTGGSFHDLAKR